MITVNITVIIAITVIIVIIVVVAVLLGLRHGQDVRRVAAVRRAAERGARPRPGMRVNYITKLINHYISI